MIGLLVSDRGGLDHRQQLHRGRRQNPSVRAVITASQIHRRRDFSLWCISCPYRADPQGLTAGVKTCLTLQDDSAVSGFCMHLTNSETFSVSQLLRNRRCAHLAQWPVLNG
jgi:hypothetical protein